MRISVSDARQRLSKAGIELRSIRRRVDAPSSVIYEIASPVGTTKLVEPQELAGLLRDLSLMSRLSA